MIIDVEQKWGVPILATLVILGAESSLGDPKLGGPLARKNNFGCIKASVQGPWSATADGTVIVRETGWWTWPSAKAGMDAWGMYMKRGAGGSLLPLAKRCNWRGFGDIYYGSEVPGVEGYILDLYKREDSIRARAEKAGIKLASEV